MIMCPSCAEATTRCLSSAGSLSSVRVKQGVLVTSASWQCYRLPLVKALTTHADDEWRQGLILQLRLQQGDAVFCGVGEVAPLPGQQGQAFRVCRGGSCFQVSRVEFRVYGGHSISRFFTGMPRV